MLHAVDSTRFHPVQFIVVLAEAILRRAYVYFYYSSKLVTYWKIVLQANDLHLRVKNASVSHL